MAREIRRIADENAALAQRAADAAEVRGKAGDLAGVDVARFAADAARVANDAPRPSWPTLRPHRPGPAARQPPPSAQLDTSDDWPAAAPAPAADTGERPDLRRRPPARPSRPAPCANSPAPSAPATSRWASSTSTPRPTPTTPTPPPPTASASSVPLFINYDYRGDIARSEADYTAAEQQLLATRAAVATSRPACRPKSTPAAPATTRLRDVVLPAAEKGRPRRRRRRSRRAA